VKRSLWIVLGLVAAGAVGFAAGRAVPPGSEVAQAPPSAAAPGSGAEEPAAGKWRPARTAAPSATGDHDSSAAPEALLATPYLQGYRPAGEAGAAITVYRRDRAWNGLNFYVSGHAPEAILMDMEGRVLHRWGYPLKTLRPDLYRDPATRDQIRKIEYFRRARLLPNGDVLAVFEGLGLIRLDPDSNLVWAYQGGAHHDLDIAPDGRIFVLDREGKEIPWLGRKGAVLEDQVTILDPATGQVERKISILEAFERSLYAPLLTRMAPRPDLLHTNTLEILDGRLVDRSPAFRAGNLLISVLELDTIAVLDPDRGEIVWALTGPWRKQHQPTVVGPRSLLVFDNLGAGQDRSRVLEIDPFTQEVLWRYGGDRKTDFFSKTLGTAARLPNGDTLITESENGRAFEVTPKGTEVWGFVSPHRAGENDELVAVLFEMVRLPPDFPFQGRR